MSHPFVQTRKIRNIVLFLHKWPRVDERPQRLKEGRARPLFSFPDGSGMGPLLPDSSCLRPARAA